MTEIERLRRKFETTLRELYGPNQSHALAAALLVQEVTLHNLAKEIGKLAKVEGETR